jgi:predicted GNAT family N-acyltransferase
MASSSTPLYLLEVEFSSPEYDDLIALRTEVLRIPLGLEFQVEDLAKEWADIHFGCYDQLDNLVGTMLLRKSVDSSKTTYMKQVAVKPALQNKGIGQFMVAGFEDYCKKNGFSEIKLHARDVAKKFYLKNGYLIEGKPFMEIGIEHWKMEKVLSVDS